MTRIVQLAVFLSVLIPASVFAGYVYVNDTLRVGVRPEPSNSVGPISVVVTGMKLEVLERNDGYLKIKTDGGVEGWIKDIYVTETVPAQIELEQLRKKFQQLSSESGKSGDQIKAAQQANLALSDEVDSLKKQNRELQIKLMKHQESVSGGSNVLKYLLLALLFVGLLVAGIFIGVIWHRRQAMKRLGGLRV